MKIGGIDTQKDSPIFVGRNTRLEMVMLYNRKTLCLLAGIQLEHFKEAARVDPATGVDNLPITLRDDGRPSSHARYDELDVLAVACAAQLAAGGGVVHRAMPFFVASKIVGSVLGLLPDAVRLKREGRELQFIGYVSLTAGGFNVADTMGKIALKIATDYPDEVVNVFLTSPASVAVAIEARAAAEGIDWKTERLWQAE